MTTFPSLQPTDRRFTPGSYPNRALVTYSGREGRVRQSNVMVSSTVRLAFTGLTATQMLSIATHYNGQFGGFAAFDLPSSVWLGFTTPSAFQLGGYLWRYASPPTVEDLQTGYYNVDVSLESVPYEGATLLGLTGVVKQTFAAGYGYSYYPLGVITYTFTPGTFAATGGSFNQNLTFDAGLPSGSEVMDGFGQSVAYGFVSGTVTADSNVAGLGCSINYTWNSGFSASEVNTNGLTSNVTYSFAVGSASSDAHAIGLVRILGYNWLTGYSSADATANGLSLTINYALSPGVATTSITTGGFNNAMSYILTNGYAQADTVISGFNLTTQYLLTPGTSSATAFNVLSLSPSAWWDSSDTSTVTLSGSNVTQLNDKSGNSFTLTQASSSNRPTYTTNAINGLGALTWPDTNNAFFLNYNSTKALTAAEIYVVLKYPHAYFDNYNGIFNNNTSPGNAWLTCGQQYTVGMYSNSSSGFNTLYVNNDNSNNRFASAANYFQYPCIARFVVTSASVSSSNFNLGMDRNYTFYNRGWRGYIGELLVFSTALASTDRQSLMSYLSTKWGITIN